MNEKVRYWLDLSDYDYETAVAMQQSGRYLYVGFMCHQTVEKILKAYYSSVNPEQSAYTHNLSYLAKTAGLYESFSEEFRDFIDLLEPLNIESRYPSHKENLMKGLTKVKCEEILVKTQKLQSWIKAKL
jgi:HEPN domain-containing protein